MYLARITHTTAGFNWRFSDFLNYLSERWPSKVPVWSHQHRFQVFDGSELSSFSPYSQPHPHRNYQPQDWHSDAFTPTRTESLLFFFFLPWAVCAFEFIHFHSSPETNWVNSKCKCKVKLHTEMTKRKSQWNRWLSEGEPLARLSWTDDRKAKRHKMQTISGGFCVCNWTTKTTNRFIVAICIGHTSQPRPAYFIILASGSVAVSTGAMCKWCVIAHNYVRRAERRRNYSIERNEANSFGANDGPKWRMCSVIHCEM